MSGIPTIAIVGRPNVGKSSLFNRLIGKKQAITAHEAGTTRDRIMSQWEVLGYKTILVDTGGLEYGKEGDIEDNIRIQAQLAIEDATVILFIIDTIEGLTSEDYEAASILRKTSKPVILIANKCDDLRHIENNISNIYELGFGSPIEVSAIHNSGIDQMKVAIGKELKKLKVSKGIQKKNEKTDKDIKICILGRPNAGKSSLANAFLGQNKIIVSEIPGTTRDSIDIEFEYNDQKYTLIDTAGIRRPGKIKPGVEKYSSLRAISAISRSDICVLLIDGVERISHQDCHIAQYILEEKKGVMIAINKTDLFDKKERDSVENSLINVLKRKFAFLPYAPVLFISAKNKKNIYKILDFSVEIMKERFKKVPTAELNVFLQEICYKHLPASTNIRKPKFKYASQVETNPPRFVLFFKYAENLHFSYPRYLENRIREKYGFNGTPIELKFKSNV